MCVRVVRLLPYSSPNLIPLIRIRMSSSPKNVSLTYLIKVGLLFLRSECRLLTNWEKRVLLHNTLWSVPRLFSQVHILFRYSPEVESKTVRNP